MSTLQVSVDTFYIKGRPKSTHQNFKNWGDLDQVEAHLASNKYTDFLTAFAHIKSWYLQETWLPL